MLDKVLQIRSKTFFVIEMPNYKLPLFKNVGITVVEKTKSFVLGAGKIILAISIILWVLASYGPGDFNNAASYHTTRKPRNSYFSKPVRNKNSAFKLEHSYIGHAGKFIEPAVRPSGL